MFGILQTWDSSVQNNLLFLGLCGQDSSNLNGRMTTLWGMGH